MSKQLNELLFRIDSEEVIKKIQVDWNATQNKIKDYEERYRYVDQAGLENVSKKATRRLTVPEFQKQEEGKVLALAKNWLAKEEKEKTLERIDSSKNSEADKKVLKDLVQMKYEKSLILDKDSKMQDFEDKQSAFADKFEKAKEEKIDPKTDIDELEQYKKYLDQIARNFEDNHDHQHQPNH